MTFCYRIIANVTDHIEQQQNSKHRPPYLLSLFLSHCSSHHFRIKRIPLNQLLIFSETAKGQFGNAFAKPTFFCKIYFVCMKDSILFLFLIIRKITPHRSLAFSKVRKNNCDRIHHANRRFCCIILGVFFYIAIHSRPEQDQIYCRDQ